MLPCGSSVRTAEREPGARSRPIGRSCCWAPRPIPKICRTTCAASTQISFCSNQVFRAEPGYPFNLTGGYKTKMIHVDPEEEPCQRPVSLRDGCARKSE